MADPRPAFLKAAFTLEDGTCASFQWKRRIYQLSETVTRFFWELRLVLFTLSPRQELQVHKAIQRHAPTWASVLSMLAMPSLTMCCHPSGQPVLTTGTLAWARSGS